MANAFLEAGDFDLRWRSEKDKMMVERLEAVPRNAVVLSLREGLISLRKITKPVNTWLRFSCC
jgi:hypothetical protein